MSSFQRLATLLCQSLMLIALLMSPLSPLPPPPTPSVFPWSHLSPETLRPPAGEEEPALTFLPCFVASCHLLFPAVWRATTHFLAHKLLWDPGLLFLVAYWAPVKEGIWPRPWGSVPMPTCFTSQALDGIVHHTLRNPAQNHQKKRHPITTNGPQERWLCCSVGQCKPC